MVIKDNGLNTSNLDSAEEANRAVTSITKILTTAVKEAVPRGQNEFCGGPRISI
jgi:hypothetical protein